MTFEEIDKLVELSQQPLENKNLEAIMKRYEPENYYRFLYHLILATKPKVCIELGVYQAVASTFMAFATSQYGGWVVGIDINGVSLHDKFNKHKPKNYIFINGDSTAEPVQEIVKKIAMGKVGLVYQDSSHHYTPSCQEWAFYSQMLSENAVWICDDITPSFHDPNVDPPGKGMVQYFEGLPGKKKLYPNVLHYGSSQGVILT